MNYKDAMLAWLANHDVKLDMYYKGNWVAAVHNNKMITPAFYMDQEYRLRPVKRKIRVAKFSPLYKEQGGKPGYIVVNSRDYKEISSHPAFLQWDTEELEVE